jgi:hypothetical protein
VNDAASVPKIISLPFFSKYLPRFLSGAKIIGLSFGNALIMVSALELVTIISDSALFLHYN